MNEIVGMVTYVIEKLKEDHKEEDELKKLKQKKMKKSQRRSLEEKEKEHRRKVADRIVFKQTLCGFISNLSLDDTFRKFFAAPEFLEYMIELLTIEKDRKNFDWVDTIERIFGVLINVTLNASSHEFLVSKGIFNLIEGVSSMTYYSPEHKTIITRLLYLLSRLVTQPEIILNIVNSKIMMIRIFLYFNRDFPELNGHVLKILFALFKLKDKLSEYTTEHEINVDNFVREAKHLLSQSIDPWSREKFINLSGMVSASLESFPDSSKEYGDLIPGLTNILKEKIDLERKNSAVLLAKLARDESNKKLMNEHHTMEVLMSVSKNLV
jgi:hypothetical protein